MVERKKKNGGISRYFLFFLLLLIVAAAGVLLYPVFREYQKRQSQLAEQTAEFNELRSKSTQLNAEVAGLKNSPTEVEKVARKKFKLVKEGESVYQYDPPPAPGK